MKRLKHRYPTPSGPFGLEGLVGLTYPDGAFVGLTYPDGVNYNLRDLWGVSREPLMKSRSVSARKIWLRVHTLIHLIGTAFFIRMAYSNIIILIIN